jgi:predicted alpha/beta superfamily hydrolase
MKYDLAKHWFLVAGLLMITCQMVGQSLSPSDRNQLITLERTEKMTFNSEIVQQEYELFISLPASYYSGEKDYPLIIGLDAYTGFLVAKGCIDAFTSLYPLMPEVILVGIGYGGTGYNEFARWIAGRTRDFTPVNNPSTEEFYKSFIDQKGSNQLQVQTGGAAQFLKFLNKELLPYLQEEYRIDNDNKALFGASLGGLFTFYTLFNSTDSFNKYFIESPSVQYCKDIIFEGEIEYAEAHTDMDVEIFLCAGGLETDRIDKINKLDSILHTRDYKNLHLEKVIFEGESHISCAPAAISRGLIELYNN